MKEFLEAMLGRSLSGLAVWLVLFPLSLPTAVFAAINVAIALTVFAHEVPYFEGPDLKGAELEKLFGVSPGLYLTLQSLALAAALLLMLSPFLIGVAIAAAQRRLLIATSIAGLVLQATSMLILESNAHPTFIWDEHFSSPGAWGCIGIMSYLGLGCWGYIGKFSPRALPKQPLRLNSAPPAIGSE